MTATQAVPGAPTGETRSMRTGVLMHPSAARSGRFLILPHPRTLVPTYYLSHPSSSSAGLLELTTLQDTRCSRSWMLSHLNAVLSAGQLEILAPVDVRFLLISQLSLLGGGYRSVEDCFEQVALDLYARRNEALSTSVPELKAAEGLEEGWPDVVALGNLHAVQEAMRDVCDTQTLPTGDQAFRLSRNKVFALLDTKLARLATRDTFANTPNTLGRSFERRWTGDSDPSPYLSTTQGEDCAQARKLRNTIAAEVIATNLPPKLAVEYFTHLGISLD